MPFYACACGKVLISEIPIPLVDQLIFPCGMEAITPNTIVCAEAFWHELSEVARRGYAFDDREATKIGSGIAVPVRDRDGMIIAGLSYSGFVGVDDTDALLRYLPACWIINSRREQGRLLLSCSPLLFHFITRSPFCIFTAYLLFSEHLE